jgi:acyl-CoA thioester hydrolase
LLRGLGWSYREMELDGVRLPVIEATCSYLQAGRYDDELDITASAQVLSPVRIAFDYEVVRQADQAVLARGRTVHAAVTPTGRPCRLPQRARTLLS